MKKRAAASLLLALGAGLILSVREGGACTTFCLRRGQDVVYGKNYDWRNGDGLLMTNKRGVVKASVPPEGERPVRWTSKHGSVTFNQWGREFPSGGMNEAGLVVELMWLDETRYPASDGRPALGGLEWIQYQLDNFARIDDVVRQAAGLRIVSDAPLHYLVCERSGRCATVEFLDGKLVSHSGATLPVPALTNHTYAESLRFVKNRDGEEASGGYGSLERFARASAMMKGYEPRNGGTPVDYAFKVLDRVAQGAYTQWSIVYDLRNLKIHFKTRANRNRRSVDLRAFDFSCATPVRMIDLAAAGSGDVTSRFVPYTPERNRQLVRRSFATTPEFRDTPAEAVTAMADYPERTSCALHP